MKIVPLNFEKTGKNKLHDSRKGLKPADVDTFFRYDIEIPESALELRIRFTHSPKIITSPEENRRAVDRALTMYAADFDESFDWEESVEFLISTRCPLRNMLRVYVYDQNGECLGEGVQDYSREYNLIIINSRAATAGLRCAPIVSGKWQVEVQIGSLLTESLEYKIMVETSNIVSYEPSEVRSVQFAPSLFQVESSWKKGYLHVHSNHSDGKNSVQELANAVSSRRLDFFALTDHNTVTGWQEVESEDSPVSILRGVELGAMAGHSLGIGIKRPVDWRHKDGSLRDINEIADDIHSQGGIFGVAHPFVIGYPVCAQCRWLYEGLDYSKVDFIEVWGYPFKTRYHEMRQTLEYWDSLLNKGYRISGTASIDLHDLERKPEPSPFPYNCVNSKSYKEEEIIGRIRQGGFYCSDGAQLDFEIIGRYYGAGLGDCIKNSGDPIEIKFSCYGFLAEETPYIRLVQNGQWEEADSISVADSVIRRIDVISGESGWFRLEIYRDFACTDLAILANPVYYS
jgi:hypothetical protein